MIFDRLHSFYQKYKDFFGFNGMTMKENTHRNDLHKQSHQVFIRIDGFDFGTGEVGKNDVIICSISPKTIHMNQSKVISLKDINRASEFWTYQYRNANRSSFILTVYKKQVYRGNIELGKVEIGLNSFTPNQISKKTCFLTSSNNSHIKVRLSVHRSENGSKAFIPIHFESNTQSISAQQ